LKKEPEDVLLNPMRFRIAKLLNPTEKSASEVADCMDIELKLATFHLQKLAKNGIVEGKYKERLVQNRPFLIQYYVMTAKGKDAWHKIKNQMQT